MTEKMYRVTGEYGIMEDQIYEYYICADSRESAFDQGVEMLKKEGRWERVKSEHNVYVHNIPYSTSLIESDERQMVEDFDQIDDLLEGITLGNINALVDKVTKRLIEDWGLTHTECLNAELEFYWQWDVAELRVNFKRPENDEEYKKRMAEEEKKRIAAEKKEQRERTMLANLKKKYEGAA